jgi:hypothetical protein
MYACDQIHPLATLTQGIELDRGLVLLSFWMSWGRETYLLIATIFLLLLDRTTSSVVVMSPQLSRIIFALTDFENLQWSVAKPIFEPGTCGILSRTVNPLVEYSI